MADRLPARAARQRIGTALSRELLVGLRTAARHTATAFAPLEAMQGLEGTDMQQPSSAVPDVTEGSDTRQCDQIARPPCPETGEFSVYSPFGRKVQAASIGTAEIEKFPMTTEDEDHVDGTASEPAALSELINEPIRRRSWLLAKALETHPLDQALDLARTAEAFITGSSNVETKPEAHISERDAPTTEPEVIRGPQSKKPRVKLGLAPDERDRLLDRLAQGARNIELASEFNLSAKQVQGIRIGSAREISRRRNTA